MRRSVLVSLLVLACTGCGDEGTGEPDLYFARDDTVRLPEGDATGTPTGDSTGLPDGVSADGLNEGGSCVPGCTNKTCGPDGCGGQCGTCAAGAHCDGNGICVPDGCQPQCEGKFCGDNGCGGSCGACPAGYVCDVNGICKHDLCQPQCSGKECGDDGCGGSCGTCPPGEPSCVNGKCTGGCAPSCAGKECGDDGCGGKCGTCGAPDICLNGQCVCEPSCTGKECGNDGCGGSCGKCNAPESCNASGQCENMACKLVGTLECDTTVEGSTVGLANGFSSYGCGFDASGPEALYQFSSPTKVYVQIDMVEPGAGKHNVYVIKGDCNPNVCVTNDFDSVHWTATPGTTYVYSVDGYQGASGAFTLTVTCIDSGDCPDGKIPACTKGQCQYGHWLGDGNCTSAFDCAEMGFDNGDCQ